MCVCVRVCRCLCVRACSESDLFAQSCKSPYLYPEFIVLLPSPPLIERSIAMRCHTVCVSAALVSAAKVMLCIQYVNIFENVVPLDF